jgi:hypothetical protein
VFLRSFNALSEGSITVNRLSPITKAVRTSFKKIGDLPGGEHIVCWSLFPVSEGSFALVSSSMSPELLGIASNHVSSEVVTFGAFLLERTGEGLSTSVTLLYGLQANGSQVLPKSYWNSIVLSYGLELSNLRNYVRSLNTLEGSPDIRYYLDAVAEIDGSNLNQMMDVAYLEGASAGGQGGSMKNFRRLTPEEQRKAHYKKKGEEVVDIVLQQTSDLGSWEFVQETKNVKMYRKPAEVPLVMGVGVIEAPIWLVLDTWSDLSKKSFVDSLFEKGNTIERIDDVTTVDYLLYGGVWVSVLS